MHILRGPLVRVLIALAIAQVTGWGTVGLLAIVGRQIAIDLQMNIAAVFAGNSVFYVVMGLWAPLLAKAFIRHGARKAMMVGCVIGALGFAGLALSNGPLLFFASWVLLGSAGAATLTTAAYIALNEIAGRDARSAIGALMLVTGLASSIFWPTTAFLSDVFAWRATCLVYAAAMLLVCLPLYAFGLPRCVKIEEQSKKPFAVAQAMPPRRAEKSTFYLISATISLNAFVTFGFSAVLVELLKAEGLSATDAVAFGSSLGVIQVSADCSPAPCCRLPWSF